MAMIMMMIVIIMQDNCNLTISKWLAHVQRVARVTTQFPSHVNHRLNEFCSLTNWWFI